MPKWKPEYQIAFLGYLLLLNLIVFGSFYYLLLNIDIKQLFNPKSTPEEASIPYSPPSYLLPTSTVVSQVVTSTSTVMPEEPLPAITEQAIVAAQIQPEDTNTPIPTSTSTATHTNTPIPTSTSTATDTNTPIPTGTPTATHTNTPRPTPISSLTRTRSAENNVSSLSTTTSTPIPIATNTSTPIPTATNTSTPIPTATNTSTPIPTATNTSTPIPTATNTSTPIPTTTNTSTPIPTTTNTSTPIPTTTNTSTSIPTPVAVAVLPEIDNNTKQATVYMEAIPLSNGSIALNWPAVREIFQYRIYSDMGSGYDLYIYKATTTKATFVDRLLRQGMAYSYRITSVKQNQEIMVSQAKAEATDNKKQSDNNLRTQKEQPNPIETVIPVPTALPPDTILLGLLSDNHFTDNFNSLSVVGEVRNDSNLNVGQTDITITFYDIEGTVVDSTHGETIITAIPPGETSAFLITLPRPAGMTSYSIRAIARPVPPKRTAQLDVIELRRFETDSGFFHIKGMIKNLGSASAKRTKVVAIIYGRDGRVINVAFASVDPPILAPGEQATYDVIFTYYPSYLTQIVIPFTE